MTRLHYRFAWQDAKQGSARLRVLLLCLVLGVGLMASLGSLIAAINASLQEDASTLLGGDILITLTHRPATRDEKALLASLGEVTTMINARSMALSAAGQRRLVEIKAVDAAYPLYGEWRIKPLSARDAVLSTYQPPYPLLVVPAFLDSLGVAMGDSVTIAGVAFTITGLVEQEPDAVASGLNFGARVMMSEAALAATGMLETGGFVRYRYGVRLPLNVSLLQALDKLEQSAPDAGWSIEDRRNASPSTRQFVARIGTYLTLVAMATLAIGGLGMSSATFAYLQYKKTTIAVLKATGALKRDIVTIYALQIAGIASVGIALGVLIGASMPWLVVNTVGHLLPVPLKVGIYGEALALAAMTGMAVTAFFTALPLAAAMRIPAASLFRHMDDSVRFTPTPISIAVLSVLALLVIGCFLLVAQNAKLVMLFGGGMVGAAALLLLGSEALRALLMRFSAWQSVAWRFATKNLQQQPARTRMIIVSYGLGFAVLATVAALDRNFQQQLLNEIPQRAPTFFIVDIGKGDAEKVVQTIRTIDTNATIAVEPTLRGRIVAANGQRVDMKTVPEDIAWAFNADRGLSFRNAPPSDGSVTRGAWWPEDYQGESLVSVDRRIAEGLGLGLGDTVTVNVLGRPLTARIANMRDINWSTLSINFTFIFDKATLAKAPYTYLATATVAPEQQGAVIEALARVYPQITAIDVKSALSGAQRIMQAISTAARVATIFTIITGLLVFAGIGAANIMRHIQESTILKVLGATRGQIMRILLVEYGIMGGLAGMIAMLAGTGMAYMFVTQILTLPWQWPWVTLVSIVLVSIAMALLVGGVVLYRVLRVRPATILRHDG